MRFGLNYTPRVGWFHSWLDFDADAVRRDLAQIRELEADHVRIFPRWDLIQPNRSLIRPEGVAAVGRVVDIAAEFELDVNVDALQGHLSSFDFLPSWLTTWHEYVRVLAAEVSTRANVMGITLGNETSQFAARPHPRPFPADPADAEAWTRTLLGAARGAGRGLITHATYDATWYDERQPFLPEHAARLGDETVVHSWVFNGSAQLSGGLGTGSVRHAEYLVQLAAAWHLDAGRRVWLQEIGTPITVVDPGDAVEFLERTVRYAAGVAGVSGITWWCSHDVSRALADFPAVEYDLGLIDENGRTKPTGRAFAELARELRGRPAPEPEPVALVLDDAGPYRADCAPGGAFFDAWMRHADRTGRGAQVVLRSLAGDTALLAARGIRELVHPDPGSGRVAALSSGGAAATMHS
jgi:hypothetical protein